MYSVTQRVNSVSTEGYVPKSLFEIKSYEDGLAIYEIRSSLLGIQGIAVDYMTRYLISGNKESAFKIPLLGAMLVDAQEKNNDATNNANKLLYDIDGLNEKSIINAAKLACYDVAYRRNPFFYVSPDNIEWDNNLFKNISVLIKRTLFFLDEIGPVILDGFTFEGGYTDLVNRGDGDYLTKNMLIDLKVSKKDLSSSWSLQLLLYYILGIHSIHPEFKKTNKLCIFNPYLNKSYICQIKDISNKSKYEVSYNVLGYKMLKSSHSSWKEVNGSDPDIYNKALKPVLTNFNVENYKDGIYDISFADYYTYMINNNIFFKYRLLNKRVNSINLIKKNGYHMFVSICDNGKPYLMQGGRLRSLKHPLKFYYDNLDKYAQSVISKFKNYWDLLRDISEFFKSLKKRPLLFDSLGKIHGCIIDIDMLNHIYVNPYDGTVTPYYAPQTMFDKNIYINTRSLLEHQVPKLIPAFDRLISKNKSKAFIPLLTSNTQGYNLLESDLNKPFVKVYDTDMYSVSNKLFALQKIYDLNLVQVWYDEILNEGKIIEDKSSLPNNSKVLIKSDSLYI